MNSRHKQRSVPQKSLVRELIILFAFLAIFWIVEIIDVLVFQGSLDRYGIQPHSLTGLRGIVFAPFLHGGFGHLIANSIPFLVLGWLTMIQETSDFFIVTLLSAIVGGMGVWLFAPTGSVHVGASILIYGYLGFLLFRGYFQKNIPSIILSIVVFFVYGGYVWGVLPSQMGISWQGHLFGFIGGIIAASAIAKEKKYYK
ncbi:rhomboid family intramembrane serine protease [Myxosarcina sp. GI1]|uniref:rhomboid family intramembrane serine protease n=1 Tax=Myxosarcina sp. GI1 TaxID=1541065 RepID=UPI00055A4AA3